MSGFYHAHAHQRTASPNLKKITVRCHRSALPRALASPKLPKAGKSRPTSAVEQHHGCDDDMASTFLPYW
jgi:hypothetical protein